MRGRPASVRYLRCRLISSMGRFGVQTGARPLRRENCVPGGKGKPGQSCLFDRRNVRRERQAGLGRYDIGLEAASTHLRKSLRLDIGSVDHLGPRKVRGAFQARVIVQPATRIAGLLSRGRERGLPGSKAIHPVMMMALMDCWPRDDSDRRILPPLCEVFVFPT
jgi:hypothetical protein